MRMEIKLCLKLVCEMECDVSDALFSGINGDIRIMCILETYIFFYPLFLIQCRSARGM